MKNNYPKMKTSVIMTRQMGEFNVIQRTSDGYFNANDLLLQWNKSNPNQIRKISRFLNKESSIKFINEIVSQETQGAKTHLGEFQAVITIKGKNTKYGKKPDKVFMHPYLYLDFAMWLSSEFKYQVIKFVYDELIEFRHAAGIGNNELMDVVLRKWEINVPNLYRDVNYALNYIVFGTSYRGIRNNATIEQLRDLRDLQKIYGYNIDTGMIKNIKTLKLMLRKEYVRRYLPNHKTLRQ